MSETAQNHSLRDTMIQERPRPTIRERVSFGVNRAWTVLRESVKKGGMGAVVVPAAMSGNMDITGLPTPLEAAVKPVNPNVLTISNPFIAPTAEAAELQREVQQARYRSYLPVSSRRDMLTDTIPALIPLEPAPVLTPTEFYDRGLKYYCDNLHLGNAKEVNIKDWHYILSFLIFPKSGSESVLASSNINNTFLNIVNEASMMDRDQLETKQSFSLYSEHIQMDLPYSSYPDLGVMQQEFEAKIYPKVANKIPPGKRAGLIGLMLVSDSVVPINNRKGSAGSSKAEFSSALFDPFILNPTLKRYALVLAAHELARLKGIPSNDTIADRDVSISTSQGDYLYNGRNKIHSLTDVRYLCDSPQVLSFGTSTSPIR